MHDVFDQIAAEPKRDIFDEISEQPDMAGGDMFDQIQRKEGVVFDETGNIFERMYGASMRGWMQLGRAAVNLPASIVRQTRLIPHTLLATEISRTTDNVKRKRLLQRMADEEKFYDTLADELGRAGKIHRVGQEAIERNHPEWKNEPPENFLDLVTSPDKLLVALSESTPLLLSAGILTIAGQPQIATSLMFASEGQQAYDQAVADGASRDDAELAYTTYGTVSAALETMQLQGIIKVAKGAFRPLLARTAQKVAKKGMRSLTMDVIKIAAQEALEEMAQGIWGEVTAKIVYDKSIPGGLADFLDRRAQEGFLGFAMGVLPGAGGAFAAKSINTLDVIREQLDKKTDITTEQKESVNRYIGDIETQIVENVIDRFPDPINDQESLERVGNQILEASGAELPDKMNWVWDTTGRVHGPYKKRWLAFYKPDTKTITINAANPELKAESFMQYVGRGPKFTTLENKTPGDFNQDAIKRVLLHEIGHPVEPKKRRIWHTKKFDTWVNNQIANLLEQTEKKVVPIERPEAVGPVMGRKVYKGKAYRAETGFKVEGTAADIIRYEQEELGNDLGITSEQLARLENIPSDRIVWVARDKKTAARYAQADIEEKITPEDIASVSEITESVEGGEIIVEMPDGVLVLKPIAVKEPVPPTPVPAAVLPKRLTRKRALKIGHELPKLLGWTEEQRRTFMIETTGKDSMKDMTQVQRKTLINALYKEAEKAGIEYEEPVSSAEELVETLERTKKITELPPKIALNRRKVFRFKRVIMEAFNSFYEGLVRIERFLEGLDGHTEGPHYNHIWKPVKNADEMAIEKTNRRVGDFLSYIEGRGIDTAIWIGQADKIPGTKIELTASQRIGIYSLSQNKNGLHYLIRGMGYTKEEIRAAREFMSDQEKSVADWLAEQYETQWPIIEQAAIQAGIDLETLKKEFRYAPLIRTDIGFDEQTDFLSALAERFRLDSLKPDQGMLEKRKAGAFGKVELDAFVMYMHNIARVERFVSMAPVARKVGKILHNRKFKQALNDRTYGQGSRLLNDWMKDAVRGTSSHATSSLGKAVAVLRQNGIVYAIGYNIPSSLRQTLSLQNAIAVDPLMLEYVPLNTIKASTPKGYKAIEEFVYDRSLLVKTRSYDRDLRQKWHKKALKQKLLRKKPWSKRAMRWIRWMDRHTVVVAWKSLYDVGLKKFDTDEQRAIDFADKWITRTQPMAGAKDLPMFFRGGQLEKLLTTFQNQINNNGNFYLYDIIGAKKTEKIGWTMVAYRTMFSYILPALTYGMIGRARYPKSWKEIMIDLSTYPLAPIIVVGRWMDRIIRGWGQSGTIAETGPEAFVKFGRAVKKGNIRKIIRTAAQTIGAFTGRIPAQAIRTTEGAIDLLIGLTGDLRRLVYSKWALEQGEKKEEDMKSSRTR